MIRSRDRSSSLWSCRIPSMCLAPLRGMSDQPAITFLLGALDLRQRSRSRICMGGVCSCPIIAMPSLPPVAHADAQTCFSRLAREVKEMREEPPPTPTRHTEKDRVASSCRASLHYHICLAQPLTMSMSVCASTHTPTSSRL